MSLRNPFRLYNNFLCCLWALFRWFTVKLQSRIWWGVWPAWSRLFWWTCVLSCPRHLALSIKDVSIRCYVVKGAGGSNFCKCQIQPRRTSTKTSQFKEKTFLLCYFCIKRSLLNYLIHIYLSSEEQNCAEGWLSQSLYISSYWPFFVWKIQCETQAE